MSKYENPNFREEATHIPMELNGVWTTVWMGITKHNVICPTFQYYNSIATT